MNLRALFFAVLVISMLASPLFAKIRDPEPLLIDGVEYSSHANEVAATQKASGELIWKIILPIQWKTEKSGGLETDAQWNIISELQLLESGELLATFRRGDLFAIDRKTGKWRQLPQLPAKTKQLSRPVE